MNMFPVRLRRSHTFGYATAAPPVVVVVPPAVARELKRYPPLVLFVAWARMNTLALLAPRLERAISPAMLSPLEPEALVSELTRTFTSKSPVRCWYAKWSWSDVPVAPLPPAVTL